MWSELDERHNMIWHGEQVFAHELSKVLIQKPKVTVWIILLPLLFLFFIQDLRRYKAGIRNFAEGFLKNKKIALDLAFNALSGGGPLDETLAAFAADSRPEDAGLIAMHEKQLLEITCLATHFQRLLIGNGRTYEELLQNTYGSAGNYQKFLDELFELEAAVIETALAVNPTQEEAHELVALMQGATRRIRRQECVRIFKS